MCKDEEVVSEESAAIDDIIGPKKKFVLLKKYLTKYGDPKKNKHRITMVECPMTSRQEKAVFVPFDEDGVWDGEMQCYKGSRERMVVGSTTQGAFFTYASLE